MVAVKKSRAVYLSLIVSLLALVLMFVSYASKKVFQDNAFQINQIKVTGDYNKQVNIALLEKKLNKYVGTGFFVLDTAKIRQEVLSFPWIIEAKVSRLWPDKIIIDIQQEQVLARWSKGGYVGSSGRIFHPHKAPSTPPQAVFFGSESALIEMIARYRQVTSVLTRHGQFIVKEKLDAFGGLEITSNTGVLYRIGRKNYTSLMQDFFKAYAVILKNKTDKRKIKTVDMRYNHGFSVVWSNV